jgi:hypothetical protein
LANPYDFDSKNYRKVSPALMTAIIKKIQEKGLFGKFCGNESGGMGKWPP